MSKIAILAATHKKYNVLDLEGYYPIQVGASKAVEDFGYLKDNTGENISSLNFTYCELTAMYWMWKNYREGQYWGLCHYRRYLSKNLNQKEKGILREKDILRYFKLGKKIIAPKYSKKQECNGWLYRDKKEEEQQQSWVLMRKIFESDYPEYLSAFDTVLYGEQAIFSNMFISSRDVFCDYCEWVFPLLDNFLKKYNAIYEPVPRMAGFISEYLFNIWLIKHFSEDEVQYLDVYNTEVEYNSNLIKRVLKKMLRVVGIKND